MTEWRLDTSSGIPLYLQLKQQIIQKVIQGEWKPGYQLPTVRQLAVMVSINVNTVSKVYAELERDGFVRTQQGKGTFVRQAEEWAENPVDRSEYVHRFAKLVAEMAQAHGITVLELAKSLEKLTSS